MAPEQAAASHGRRPGRRRLRPGGDPLRDAHRPAAVRGPTSLETAQCRSIDAGAGAAAPARNPECPRDLETICLKCLDKEPAQRYASALDLADDLHRFLANEPIRARPVGPVGRLVRWARRHPTIALLLAAVVTALLVIAIGGAVYNVRLQQALAEAKDYAEKNRRGLIHLYVARGSRLLDEGENFRALAWFAEALRLEEGEETSSRHDTAHEQAHRIRLAVTLRQCPRLLQLWSHAGPVQQAVFSPDACYILTVKPDGMAQVWEGRGRDPPASGASWGGRNGKVAAFAGDRGPPRGPTRCLSPVGGETEARLWEVETGRPLSPPHATEGCVDCRGIQSSRRSSAHGKCRRGGPDVGSGDRTTGLLPA